MGGRECCADRGDTTGWGSVYTFPSVSFGDGTQKGYKKIGAFLSLEKPSTKWGTKGEEKVFMKLDIVWTGKHCVSVCKSR